jgi:hypothetical protein
MTWWTSRKISKSLRHNLYPCPLRQYLSQRTPPCR